MEAALDEGACDAIGLGRPMCVEPDLPNRLLDGRSDAAVDWENRIVPAKAALGWFCLQLLRLGDGLAPDTGLTGEAAIGRYLQNEEATAAALLGR